MVSVEMQHDVKGRAIKQQNGVLKCYCYGWNSLKIEIFETGIVIVEFKASELLALNISSRIKDAHFRIKACVKRYKPIEINEDKALRAIVLPKSKASRDEFMRELRHIVDEIANSHLTPKMVCESICITSAQREALTRDGVLKSSGQASFQSDRRIGYYKLYSAHSVREIIRGRHSSAATLTVAQH